MKVTEVQFQVAEKNRRLAVRGYDGRVVRVQGQLDVVRGCGPVVDLQTDEDRGNQSYLRHPSPHDATQSFCAWASPLYTRQRECGGKRRAPQRGIAMN
jgi:hypothetical protein